MCEIPATMLPGATVRCGAEGELPSVPDAKTRQLPTSFYLALASLLQDSVWSQRSSICLPCPGLGTTWLR